MAADSTKLPPQPRDARIVSLILQSLGVEDYDPKVVHQLLEFAHSKYIIFCNRLIFSFKYWLPLFFINRIHLRRFPRLTHLRRTCQQERFRFGRYSISYSRTRESFLYNTTTQRGKITRKNDIIAQEEKLIASIKT